MAALREDSPTPLATELNVPTLPSFGLGRIQGQCFPKRQNRRRSTFVIVPKGFGKHVHDKRKLEVCTTVYEEEDEIEEDEAEYTDSVPSQQTTGTIETNEVTTDLNRQKHLNRFLLTVTRSLFQSIQCVDTVIMKVMNFAKQLVNADRTAMFMVDERHQELYARVFDMGEANDADKMRLLKEIRFPINKGIAGYVATTGEVLTISDAYQDERFNKEVDLKTGYRTRSILCIPVSIHKGKVIGVVEMVNKIDGEFDQHDRDAFEAFAVYCGLALQHAQLMERVSHSEQKYKVACEVLSYHSMAHEEEVQHYLNIKIPPVIPNVSNFDYCPWSIRQEDSPICALYMFKDFINTSCLDMRSLVRFVLTIRKNYRLVPYHNWEHGLSVLNSVYSIIKNTNHGFTQLEQLALLVSGLTHDVDHRGKTNTFMKASESPLASLYGTSTMEQHHLRQTFQIMQHDGHNILQHLSAEDYKIVLGHIKHCIIATDLANFFGKRQELDTMIVAATFSWENEIHRSVVMDVCMTAADLCAMYKPWETHVDLVLKIMEEFWQEGDQQKQMNMQVIPMMDRDKSDQLPSCQVGFIVGICLPCYQLMEHVLPATKPMLMGLRENLSRWRQDGIFKAWKERKAWSKLSHIKI